MLRKISILAAHLVCYINVGLMAVYWGFLQGYDTKVREIEPNAMIGDPFSSVYSIFGAYHTALLLPLIIVIIASSIKERLLTHVLQIFTLAGAIWIYSGLYSFKMYYLNNIGSGFPPWYSNFARKTLIFDHICFGLLSLLLIYQIFAVIRYVIMNKTTKINMAASKPRL
ncbi:MAG TPA: hypothetical protein VGO50_00530 [Pyrinomonadaceae bacterium]|jgi:hypothetical protein|nr:hypothetical protein [Pyrinomonadaceae bacterium]